LRGVKNAKACPKASAIIIIEPKNREPWLLKISALFEDAASHAEGIYACPSSTHFLVVANCAAFYVDTENPDKTQVLEALPVRSVEKYLTVGLLLIFDFQRVIAIGKAGVLWTSK